MVRSNPVDPDVRITKEADTLADAGYDVHILGWDRDKKYPEIKRSSKYTIYRIGLKAPHGIKVILYLPIWWLFEFYRLLKEDWDIIHAADFDTFVPAMIAAKIKRKPIVYDIFDFYADEGIAPNWIRKIAASIDIFLMKFADTVIVVDESRLTEIGIHANKNIVIITNSPKDIFKNGGVNKSKKNDEFTIFFAGGLRKIKGLNIDNVITAIKGLNDVKVVIAGYGDYESELIDMSRDMKNVEFVGKIPHEEVIDRTLNADLLFALYDPAVPINKYASPNKLFEAMMCGKPILVSNGTSMVDIVRKYNCGIVVNCRDVNEIQNAIIKLKNNSQLCKQLGESGRRAYEEEYNWEIMEERLLKLYANLIDTRLICERDFDENG